MTERINNMPVLGICGLSGAGKTTLIEELARMFIDLGLRVAVVKDGAHNVRVDQPGKDSDRFYRTGADVCLLGEENFRRRHDKGGYPALFGSLCSDHDLVLVEGHGSTPVPKIWLLGKGYSEPPPGAGEVLLTLERSMINTEAVYDFILRWLRETWLRTPVWGCVLIGGRSRRMGCPKHLIEKEGRTWLEHLMAKLGPVTDKLVLAGKGELPSGLGATVRLVDAPGVQGPLAGILAAMRWNPAVTWLVAACDLPDIQTEALEWLLAKRRPGAWALLPDLDGHGRVEPLLAHYDFRCRPLFEEMALAGCYRINRITGHSAVHTPVPPTGLRISWRNVNTPEQLTLP